MDLWGALIDLWLLLAAAMVLGVLFERLRQSALLGYLAAGVLLGPNGLHLIRQEELVQEMAEVGVALLLFTIGLEFSLRQLKFLGWVALGGGTLQIVFTAAVLGGLGLALGFPPSTAFAVGILLAPSSTACVLRMLGDRSELESVHGRCALGILLLQDLALVPMVLAVTLLAKGGGSFMEAFVDLARATGYLALVICLFAATSRYVLPKLLQATALSRNRELPILLAFVTFSGAAWVAHSLGLSPAVGAFVAGMLLAESPFATQIRSDVSVLRTLFVTLFFASVGLLADPGWMKQNLAWLLATVTVIVVIKAAIVAGVVWLFRYSRSHAVASGITLAQVGEFSLVLAGTAYANGEGVLALDTYKLIIATSVITLFLTPPLVASASWISRRASERLGSATKRGARPEDLIDHVIVVGLGPSARVVVDSLQKTQRRVVVVELNPRTVAAARGEGIDAHLGDASREELLTHIHAERARLIVVTLPDHRTTLQVIRQANLVAPGVPVLARARYHAFVEKLEAAGAAVVLDEEREIGRALDQVARELLCEPTRELTI